MCNFGSKYITKYDDYDTYPKKCFPLKDMIVFKTTF